MFTRIKTAVALGVATFILPIAAFADEITTPETPDFITSLVTQFGAWVGVAVALIIAFDRLAKLTKTTVDDKIMAALHTVFSVFALRWPELKK